MAENVDDVDKAAVRGEVDETQRYLKASYITQARVMMWMT